MDWASWSLWGLRRFLWALGLLFGRYSTKDSGDWNRETRGDAQSLFLASSRFPFIIALVITTDVLANTKALSRKLQGCYVDIVRAYKQVSFVKSTLKSAMDGVDHLHRQMYDSAMQVAAKVHVGESLPRTTGWQQHHSNVPAASALESYKWVLTIPMLDYLIADMEERC